jgi:hypothetical protein
VARGGKAEGTGTCVDRCGKVALDRSCYCDDLCEGYNDCCDDKAEICDGVPPPPPGENICEGYCDLKSPKGCYCDTACVQYGDCCQDEEGTKGASYDYVKQACDTPPPPPPPAKCHTNDDCEAGSYCHFDDGACLLLTFAILEGECKPMPEACTMDYVPVCGCDNKTYSNSCMAHQGGVSVGKQGECAPKKCGPWPGGECADGEVCDIDSCALGGSGECVEQPTTDECDQQPYEPVCGCNNTTYDNDCYRLAAGERREHEGACEEECWGAWLDQYGNCRTPSDGVYPDACCAQERQLRCNEINGNYGQAVLDAKQCSPWVTAPQCTHMVASSLVSCSATCMTYIEASPTALQPYVDDWKTLKCDLVGWICAAYACPLPSGGGCDVYSATCVDFH